jgi:hypothetical protein
MFNHPDVKTGELSEFDVHQSETGIKEEEGKRELQRMLSAVVTWREPWELNYTTRDVLFQLQLSASVCGLSYTHHTLRRVYLSSLLCAVCVCIQRSKTVGVQMKTARPSGATTRAVSVRRYLARPYHASDFEMLM